MIYTTINKKKDNFLIDPIDALNNFFKDNTEEMFAVDSSSTYTYSEDDEKHPVFDQYKEDNYSNIIKFRSKIKYFNEKYEEFIKISNKNSLYRHFTIPKRNGKRRQIDAPNEDFELCLYDLKRIFESLGQLHHSSAFAYIKNRNCIDLVKIHAKKKSTFFFHSDFKDFFPSINEDFMMNTFKMLAPFKIAMEEDGFENELRKSISLCFLNGGLPQGTCISPMLTNIVMIPFDYEMSHRCRPKFNYTRYADDIKISGNIPISSKIVYENIDNCIEKVGGCYRINKEKTKTTSKYGKNWLFGMVYNGKDNISVGWRNKKIMKAAAFNLGRMQTKYSKGEISKDEYIKYIAKTNGILNWFMQIDNKNKPIIKNKIKTGNKLIQKITFL